MEQFLAPAATGFLALHSLMLFVSGVGHLVRQHLSPAPVQGTDIVLSVGLLLLALLLFASYRLFDRRGEQPVNGLARLLLSVCALCEMALAVVFYWTIVDNPSNGVSDFILGSAATTGMFTSVVLATRLDLISKRA